MVRYLIIGKTGQLGQAFVQRLGSAALAVSRAECDITDAEAVRRLLLLHRPQVVLNCAAWNFVDRAEQEPQPAFAVNALAVRALAHACSEVGAFLVHFSTDYVFGLDETRRLPYRESDLPGPVNVYGVSKLAGEYFVRSSTPHHLVIRTCGLYGVLGSGGKKDNFVERILRQATAHQTIEVVADQVCSPTYVEDLVTAVLQCLEHKMTGLVHLVNTGAVSWYEFARAIIQQAGLNTQVRPVSSKEKPTAARRPNYSALISEHPHTPPMRSWWDALQDYLTERRNHLPHSRSLP